MNSKSKDPNLAHIFFRRMLFSIFFGGIFFCHSKVTRGTEFNDGCFEEVPLVFGLYPTLCIRPSYELSLLHGTKERDLLLFHSGALYTGLHLTDLISFHGEGDLENQQSDKKSSFSVNANSLFLQLGHYSEQKFSVSIGRINQLFGLTRDSKPKVLQNLLSNNYWDTFPYGLRFRIDNAIDTSLELSMVGEAPNPKDNQMRHQKIARLTHDISALEGGRFLLSYLNQPMEEQRLGLGFYTNTQLQGVIGFEWIRVWQLEFSKKSHSDQYTRVFFEEGEAKANRFIFAYEDAKPKHWQTTFGYSLGKHRSLTIIPTWSLYKKRISTLSPEHVFTLSLKGRL